MVRSGCAGLRRRASQTSRGHDQLTQIPPPRAPARAGGSCREDPGRGRGRRRCDVRKLWRLLSGNSGGSDEIARLGMAVQVAGRGLWTVPGLWTGGERPRQGRGVQPVHSPLDNPGEGRGSRWLQGRVVHTVHSPDDEIIRKIRINLRAHRRRGRLSGRFPDRRPRHRRGRARGGGSARSGLRA